MNTIFIYFLAESDTGEVRYVGKTINPPKRLQSHCNDRSKCHRANWIQALKDRGARPEMVIVEEIHGDWPWQESERYWIAFAKACGCQLVNGTDGGDGVSNLSGESRERMLRTWLGRKHSERTKLKISESWKHRVVSDETKAKMSASQRGRLITWGDSISESLRKITASQQEEIKARIKSGCKVCDLAKEFGVHRTTISKIKMGTYNEKYRHS